MDLERRQVGRAITVPSCTCWSMPREQRIGTASGITRASVKFVVPAMAQLVYDVESVDLGNIIELLKRGGCEIPIATLRCRIPQRPLFLPEVWKMRIENLRDEVRGVVSASIDFVRSVIAVDYIPILARPHAILNALLGNPGRERVSGTRPLDSDQSTYGRRDNPDSATSRKRATFPVYLEGGVSGHCCASHPDDWGSHAASA